MSVFDNLAPVTGNITVTDTADIANLNASGGDVSAVSVIASSSITGRALETWFSDVTNVKAFGATGDGVTDDTAAINAASVAAGDGRLFFPPGTYIFSEPLIIPGEQVWVGSTRGCSALKFAGANDAVMIRTASDATSFLAGMENMTIDAGTATGVTLLELRNAQRGSYKELYLLGNGGTGNIGVSLTSGQDGVTQNCVHNRLTDIYIRDVDKGMFLSGTTSPNTAATINTFINVNIDLTVGVSGTGIDFGYWCDSNFFYYCRITLKSTNCTGVIFNSLDPTGTRSVYNEVFYSLILDNIGTITGSTGLDLNACRGIFVHNMFHSPDVFPGTLVDASADALSYYVSHANSTVSGSERMPFDGNGCTWLANDFSFPRGVDAATHIHTPTCAALSDALVDSANRLYVTPIRIHGRTRLHNLSIYITVAAGADFNIRMGLYADNDTGSPGALVSGTDTGSIAVAAATTGFVTSSSLASPDGVLLQAGLYWAAVVFDAVGTVKTDSVGINSTQSMFGGVGFTPGLIAASRGKLGGGGYGSLTFGALPSTFPSFTRVASTGDVPVVTMSC